jgi:hypothetical protein
MIMFNKARASHGLGEKAVEKICSVRHFLEVVVENDCLGNSLRIKSLVSMPRNKKTKVLKVAK